MNQGRFWAAALAGGVTLFFAGFLLWGLLLAGFFEAHVGSAVGVNKETADLFHLGLGQFFWALLLAIVIARYAGVSGFLEGLKIGAVLGFFMSLSVGLSQFSMTNLGDLTSVLTDPFVSAVWSGLGGGVVGLVLGGGKKEAGA
jgi:hypothetical protein